MTRPSRARQDLRLDALKKLDPVSEPKSSSCTSDADDSVKLIDTVLAPAAQAEDYVGDWIYVRSQAAAVDSGADINEGGQFSATDVTLTVDDGTKFTIDDAIQFSATATATGEICGVTGISSNDLTVVRGIQGTTASTHEDSDNVFIIGPAIGEIRRVTNVDFSGTTSTLTVAPAFSGSLISGQEYERHRKVRPSIINDKLDVTLGLLRQNVLLPVTAVTDGDMETSGVTNWTAAGTGGTPTLAKDTTNVRRGRFSLSITNDGSTTLGYAKSASINLNGNTICTVAADVFITAGDSARLTFYDVTNSAVIGTAMKSDETGWVHLENTFTVPATCEQVQVWLESQAASDVTYWDHVHVWPVSDQGIELPSFLEYTYDLKEIFYLPVGTGLPGSTNVNGYRINESTPQLYGHYQKDQDDTGVVPARFYIQGRQPSNALWIKGRKAYPAFSGATDSAKDTDTTVAHKDVVLNMTTASILDDLALEATEAEKPQLSEQRQIKALLLRNEISGIVGSMTPPRKKIVTTPFTRD